MSVSQDDAPSKEALRAQLREQNKKAIAARQPYSRGVHPRVLALRAPGRSE
jgi:hypothetical protein